MHKLRGGELGHRFKGGYRIFLEINTWIKFQWDDISMEQKKKSVLHTLKYYNLVAFYEILALAEVT